MTRKYHQVSVDFGNMVYTAFTYLALAGAAWIFLRLLQACFWLPRHLKKQNDVQQMLQDKVDSYEKYILECEEKEKRLSKDNCLEKEWNEKFEKPRVENNSEVLEKKWKERRECLEMLKRELKRVRDGGDPYDWNHLLDDTDDEEKNDKVSLSEDKGKRDLKIENSKAENQKPVRENTEFEGKKEK